MKEVLSELINFEFVSLKGSFLHEKLMKERPICRNILLYFKILIIETHLSEWGREGCYLKGTSIKLVSNFVCTIINARKKWRNLYGVLQ